MRMTVIYWSATGNTEAMAQAIAQGAKEAGADVPLLSVDAASAEDALQADLLALGCPAMGVAGELAEEQRLKKGTGNATFRTDLIDGIFNLTEEQLQEKMRYEVYKR